jgi:hypothetical protein
MNPAAIAFDIPSQRRLIENQPASALKTEATLSRENAEASAPEQACSGHAPQEALRQNRWIASYTVNKEAVAHAKSLIDARQYVLRSRWQNVQPRAREQNAFLKTHSFQDYALWHLGLTEGADNETKARYAFMYGDFRRLHRMGLIACHYRAAEWRHKEIELAAHELLQYLDARIARD